MLHPQWRVKRAGRHKNDTDALPLCIKRLYLIAVLLVFAPVTIVFVTVFEQVFMQLTYIVLGKRYFLIMFKNGIHYLGIACYFLFVTIFKFLDLQIGEQYLYLLVGQLAALYTGR